MPVGGSHPLGRDEAACHRQTDPHLFGLWLAPWRAVQMDDELKRQKQEQEQAKKQQAVRRFQPQHDQSAGGLLTVSSLQQGLLTEALNSQAGSTGLTLIHAGATGGSNPAIMTDPSSIMGTGGSEEAAMGSSDDGTSTSTGVAAAAGASLDPQSGKGSGPTPPPHPHTQRTGI